MANYNKGRASDLPAADITAKQMAEDDAIFAVYPYNHKDVNTKFGAVTVAECSVYVLHPKEGALKTGTLFAFQQCFVTLPLHEWSVGKVLPPGEGKRYYDFAYPGESFDEMIDKAMKSLPDDPTNDPTDEEPF